ncbi:hypothetical protein RhiirA1_453286 [Rhizophagus irregularis]|uniref:Uncharacterized protein n=1 Tax=Rhizophagus irregularis TaxID=588596 RepID=A0A2I1EDS7_9GLOM|nr:hypothetical protein RhiirA1_453286 [Rhizophagus irregularis]PKY20284.1 hypothetical protein RhiirB3_433549 [Rhizophagus irregularis]
MKYIQSISYSIPSTISLDIPTNFIARFIDRCDVHDNLYALQQTLSSSSVFDFHTDGSVTDMVKFISPYIQFNSLIDRWCSSNHAELAAVLAALLVSPLSSIITIYTDSKSIIDHYNNLSYFSFPLTPHNIFKGLNNNSYGLWF